MQVIWCYDELLFLKINRIPPTAVWGVYSNSFFYVEGVGTPSWCAENVLKLGPFLFTPIHLSEFSWKSEC